MEPFASATYARGMVSNHDCLTPFVCCPPGLPQVDDALSLDLPALMRQMVRGQQLCVCVNHVKGRAWEGCGGCSSTAAQQHCLLFERGSATAIDATPAVLDPSCRRTRTFKMAQAAAEHTRATAFTVVF